MSGFQLVGLSHEPFVSLFELSDERLSKIHARRVIADSSPGFPCRVSLQDAEPGEELILLPYEHHAVESPYRASGPIYVRRNARQAVLPPGTLTSYVTGRLMSLRVYDADHWMIGAEVCAGGDLAAGLESRFGDERVSYIHLHNAGPGCFSCRVRRC